MKTNLLAFISSILLAGTLAQAAHHSNNQGNCADGLIGDYFAVQEALAADNLETAKTAAKQLLAAHEQSPCSKAIGASSQALLDATSIAEARTAFKTLSDTLIPMVEKNGVSPETHLVHCPMAFEFTGASWLQKNKSVANPYFGSEMFSCGHVKQSFGTKK